MSKEDYRNYSNASGLHLWRGEEKYHICLSTCRCWSFVTWHIPTPSWKPNSNKLVTRKSFLTGKVKWVLFSSEKWEKMTRYQVLNYESLLANKALRRIVNKPTVNPIPNWGVSLPASALQHHPDKVTARVQNQAMVTVGGLEPWWLDSLGFSL